MADEKTFTESEHIAILADRVATETASLSAERDQLRSDKTDLETKLDVAESAKVAAEQARDEASKALDEYKSEVESEREAASRKEERLAKVKEAAAHLEEDFFKDEARVARIVAFADDQFDGYLEDLKATAKVPTGKTTTVPRETAMSGATATTTAAPASRDFLLRKYIAPGQED